MDKTFPTPKTWDVIFANTDRLLAATKGRHPEMGDWLDFVRGIKADMAMLEAGVDELRDIVDETRSCLPRVLEAHDAIHEAAAARYQGDDE